MRWQQGGSIGRFLIRHAAVLSINPSPQPLSRMERGFNFNTVHLAFWRRHGVAAPAYALFLDGLWRGVA